jgi:lipoprotein NlpD
VKTVAHRKAVALHGALAACVLGVLVSGCASRSAPAPVIDRAPSATAQPAPPVAQQTPVPGAPGSALSVSPTGTYQVKRGDTLYSIALDHGADPRDLREWNRMDSPDRLQPGQVIRVVPPEGQQQPPVQVGAARGPGAIESRPLGSRPLDPGPMATRPPETKPAPVAPSGAVKSDPKAVRLPYSSENLAMLQRSESSPQPAQVVPPPQPAKPIASVPPQPAPSAAEAPDRDAIEFIWPARGKIVARFSEPTSKGVDISGKPGDPVVAAASGRVIYIGTGIRGYGKLIVIKHDNNFNSVYGHNREILVKQDQTVTRGQQIAELGDTDADSPKLHFEIRKSGKPVDPVKYLPPS